MSTRTVAARRWMRRAALACCVVSPAARPREIKSPARTDTCSACGSRRRGDRKLLVMDCGTNRWRVIDTEMPDKGYGWDAAMVYDPLHDVAVALLPPRFSGPMRVFLLRYDPKTAKYRSPAQ